MALNPNQTIVWETLPGLGGAPGAPPLHLGTGGANFSSKIKFPWKLTSVPTHFASFPIELSKITKNIGKNWKSIKKLLWPSKISKICNYWAISTCNTSKEISFNIEFNFKQKKFDLLKEKLKKSKSFDFLLKISAGYLSLTARFSNLCLRIWKLSSLVLRKSFEIKGITFSRNRILQKLSYSISLYLN